MMNRERARELLPVIQAFAEGKAIEMRTGPDDTWGEVENPGFREGLEYRIKPEPREWDLYLDKYGAVTKMVEAGNIAMLNNHNSENSIFVRVREILE